VLAVLGSLVLLLWPGTALAQPSFAVTFGGTLDSFRPTTSAVESRQNLLGAVNLEHAFADERGHVTYDLGAGNYDSPGDWSFLQHNAALTYQFGSPDDRGRKLFLNGSVVARRNGDSWTNAEYTGAGGGVNAEFHPGEASTVRTGYRADYRRFDDLTALTQFEHRAFASVLSSFQSRTTLVGEVQVGAKRYDGAVYTELASVETTVPVPRGGRGMGASMGPGYRVVSVPSYAVSNEDGAAGLVTGLARVAQSLTDRTGIHAQAMGRWTFGSVPPMLVTTPAGFFEDGVYDDPFASNGLFLQAGAKHVFASEAEIAATGWWADKDYTSIAALDADGAPLPGGELRADRVTIGQISWTQPIVKSAAGAVALSAEIGYRYMRHRSNDAYYNYTSHAVGISLTVGY